MSRTADGTEHGDYTVTYCLEAVSSTVTLKNVSIIRGFATKASEDRGRRIKMRLIGADLLIDELDSTFFGNNPRDAVKATIYAMPTAITYCKDCKHGMYDAMCKFYWCHGMAHSANWFCADGERRNDES